MCHDKERRRQQYLLTRQPKIINFCDKTVIFNFKIVLISESLYFHIKKKKKKKYREQWVKSHIMNFA